MPFLTVNGTDVEVIVATARERPEPLGSHQRAHSGGILATYKGVKYTWDVTAVFMAPADLATFRTANPYGSLKACSGDLLGGSKTCLVLYGDKEYPGSGASYYNTLQFSLVEQ